MQETKRYPLDFSTLEKGQNIAQEQIEEIYKVKAGTTDFDLKKLELQNQIEVQLALRGILVTVRSIKNSLRILTDAEAAIYNTKRFNNELHLLNKIHARKSAVDTSNLNPTEQAIHKHDLQNQGRVIQAIQTVKRQIKVEVKQSRFTLTEGN